MSLDEEERVPLVPRWVDAFGVYRLSLAATRRWG
jgi:hypothetical protein